MATMKEVYSASKANVQLLTTEFQIIDFQSLAVKSDYLPHNKLRVANRSAEIIYIYLNGYEVGQAPDYVLGSDKILDESVLEGVNFNTVIIHNQSANTITANKIFVRVATVREV
jgi:hypothetical protein